MQTVFDLSIYKNLLPFPLPRTIYQGSCRKLDPSTLDVSSASSSPSASLLERDGYITKEDQKGVKYFDETFFVASNDEVNSTLAIIAQGRLGDNMARVLWIARTDNFRNPHTNPLPVLSARKLDTLEFSAGMERFGLDYQVN